MKNTIKVLILIACVLLSVSAVLFFVKYQMAPPKLTHFQNQFSSRLTKDLDEYVNSQPSVTESVELYNLTMDRERIYAANELIPDQENSEEMQKFVNSFAPKYVSVCLNFLSSSAWSNNDMSTIESCLADLRTSQREFAGQQSNLTELDKLGAVVSLYHNANAVAGRSSCSSLAEARSIKAKVNQYRSNSYLANNHALHQRLGSVMGRLSGSYYAHLSNKVDGCRNDGTQDYYAWLHHWTEVNMEVNDYNNNEASVFGTHNGGSLLQRMSEYRH